MKKLIWITLLSFLTISTFTFTGCKKDEEDDSISLPPSETMDMDYSFTLKKSALIADDTSYYRLARTVVTFWSVKANAYTALPVYAFKKALQNKPVYNADNDNYTWTFQFQSANDTYEAALTGEIWGDSIDWVMNITAVGGDVAFKYFEGTSAVDRSGGWWTLYHPQVGQALFIKWEHESDAIGMLRYTNIIEGDANNGAYIEFAKVNSSVFDRYFKIHIINNPDNTSMNDKTYSIDWNSTNKNGKITDGTTSVCWDTNYVNKTCE
jgi:hypothetical protein